MKVVLEILRYILVAVLSLVIFIIFLTNLGLSTVLSEKYILLKLDESNYYQKVYNDFYENISKYMLQSGLDDINLQNICGIEKVKEDTISIIENIYFGNNNQIETDSIKLNLDNKINEYIGNKETISKNKDSIEKFENIICKEYTNTIMYTRYEKNINESITRIQKIIKE